MSRPSTLLLALAALAPGCNRTPELPPVFADPRLALATLGPAPPEAAGATAYRIEPPADPSLWSYEGATPSRVEHAGGAALAFSGGGQHWVRVPGAFDPARVNLVVIELVAAHDMTVRAGLSRRAAETGGKPTVVSAEDFVFVRAGEHARAELDLRRLGEHSAGERGEGRERDGQGEPVRPFDELLLIANGKDLEWSLLAVELAQRPVEHWVPAPDSPPELVRAGLETRRATGLSSRRPLTARGTVPESGRLELSYAWPWRMPPPSRDAVLTATISGEVPIRASFPLERGADGWRSANVDLARRAGEDVTITFRLDAGGEPVACALAVPRMVGPVPSPPSVLLITSDTHRADHTGVARSGVEVATPNLDRLALEGAYFEDCFTSSSITIPSHAALLTNLNPRDTGVTDNQTPLGEGAHTLAERFAAAGWTTWAVTSAKHLNHPWSGLGQGFDRMTWPMQGLEQNAQQAVDQLEAWLPDAADQPLFVWLHLYDAHRPYEPPDELLARYYPADKDPFDPALPEPDFAPLPGYPGVRDRDWIHARYRGEVSYLDGELGRLFGTPRFADKDRAAIAVTADHGENLGEHELFWNHNALYPSTLHVPLVLRWPGVRAGTRVSAPVEQIDVGHTLLAIAGLADEPPFPGRDLRALAEGAAPPEEPRYAIASFGSHVSIQHGRWFLVLATRESPRNKESELGKSAVGRGRFERHAVELYDLDADPRCERDLIDVEPERARRLRALLLDWITTPVDGLAGVAVATPESDAVLKGLGYAGGETQASSEWIDPECECAWCARFEQ